MKKYYSFESENTYLLSKVKNTTILKTILVTRLTELVTVFRH
ncbi:hypothetical protein HMPREF1584_00759 [Gardnerella vaginalis JCP8481A]|nr:hypothetical protein HMPREF1584_00759 [Gardnerella vaginalis JCP8481A]